MRDLERVQAYINLGYEKEEAMRLVDEETKAEEKKAAKEEKKTEKEEPKEEPENNYVTKDELKEMLQEIALKKEGVKVDEQPKESTADLLKKIIN